jgi:SSS family solute:Na+ symporter
MMVTTLDKCFVCAYLAFMLVIGWRGTKTPVHTLRDYVLGNGSEPYSFFYLVCTVLATAFGAGAILGDAGKVFSHGLGFLIVKATIPVMYFLVAHVAVPRMEGFITGRLPQSNRPEYLSAGDVMGYFYGTWGQLITGFVGLVFAIGVIGAQVSAMGWILNYCMGWSYATGIGLGFGVVVGYTVLGGIRSVVATDVWQLFIIAFVVPYIANMALVHFVGTSGFVLFSPRAWSLVWEALPLRHQSLLPAGYQPLDYCFLLTLMVLPFLDPTVIQRILMSGSVTYARAMMRISAGMQVVFCVMVACVGCVGSIQFPEAQPMSIVLTVIQQYAFTGLLGFCVIGVLAAVMSTADSYLHAASVAFAHDLLTPFFRSKLSVKRQIQMARVSTILVGLLAAATALHTSDIRDLLIAILGAWGPVVVAPLWAGLLGYRASGRTFIIAVLAGQVVYWGFPHVLPLGYKLSATLPAMLANALAFALARRWDRPTPAR